MQLFFGLKHFFEHLFNATCNVFFWIITLLAWLIGYPAQNTILVCVLVFFVLDFVTKFYSISVVNKGIVNAFMCGKFSSRSFINGFIAKIVAYFITLTIIHFADCTPQLSAIGTVLNPLLYSALFFYEIVSNLENLRDAKNKFAIKILKIVNKQKDAFCSTENITDIISDVTETTKSDDITNKIKE